MTCYDLQFAQHRSVEGLVTFALEPDVYSLTRFTGLPEVKQLPYSVKQMLAREVMWNFHLYSFMCIEMAHNPPPVKTVKFGPRKAEI